MAVVVGKVGLSVQEACSMREVGVSLKRVDDH